MGLRSKFSARSKRAKVLAAGLALVVMAGGGSAAFARPWDDTVYWKCTHYKSALQPVGSKTSGRAVSHYTYHVGSVPVGTGLAVPTRSCVKVSYATWKYRR